MNILWGDGRNPIPPNSDRTLLGPPSGPLQELAPEKLEDNLLVRNKGNGY